MFAAVVSPLLSGCRKHRFTLGLFALATFICYLFVSAVDIFWTGSFGLQNGPVHAAITTRDNTKLQYKSGKDENINWEELYDARLELVRRVCEGDEVAMMRRVWRIAANRRFGKDSYCKTKMCPIIVDEQRVLFFCFIPKVASTKVKEFFLNVSGIEVDENTRRNDTALHALANDKLRRVSPMYYPATTARRFFKMIFVRHPFDRLVSAFRSKVEGPRKDLEYFYTTYWDKLMRKLRPNVTLTEHDRPTFREFIWYLIHGLERDFDDHWAPYWSRCDPCLVDYDFIGKLETSEHDFPYAFRKVGIESPPGWWKGSNYNHAKRSLTLRYFADVPDKDIEELYYRVYRLDFDLFGYTLDGFMRKT